MHAISVQAVTSYSVSTPAYTVGHHGQLPHAAPVPCISIAMAGFRYGKRPSECAGWT